MKIIAGAVGRTMPVYIYRKTECILRAQKTPFTFMVCILGTYLISNYIGFEHNVLIVSQSDTVMKGRTLTLSWRGGGSGPR